MPDRVKDAPRALTKSSGTWLEAEPDRIGRELFERLQGELPGVFADGQLRTFQRRVRDWRQAAARQLVGALLP